MTTVTRSEFRTAAAGCGLLLALAALGACRPAAKPEPVPPGVTRAILAKLDRRGRLALSDMDAGQALRFLDGVMDVGFVCQNLPPHWDRIPVTLRSGKLGGALEDWGAQVGAGWTVARAGSNPAGGPRFKIVVAPPARIAEIEKDDPATAALVRDYRRRLRAASGR